MILIASCSRPSGESEFTKVSFVFKNNKERANSFDLENIGGYRWASGTFTTTAELDCIGVIITIPGDERGSCSDSSTVIFDYTEFIGMVSTPGIGNSSTLSTSVPRSSNIEVRVFALDGTGSCPNASTFSSIDQTQFNEPKILSNGTFLAEGTETSIPISINDSSVSSGSSFISCSGDNEFAETLCSGTETGYTDIGSGTSVDPYVLCTIDQMNDLSTNGEGNGDWDKEFILGSDIDISSGTGQTGNATTNFSGVIDGNGFSLTNLTLGISSNDRGIFGVISNATIKNLTIEAPTANITASSSDVGFLIGEMKGTSSIVDNITINNPTMNVGANATNMGILIGSVTATGGTVSNINIEGPIINATATSNISQSSAGIGKVSGAVSFSNIRVLNMDITLNNGGADHTDFGGVFGSVLNGSFSRVLATGDFDNSSGMEGQNTGGIFGKIAAGANITIDEVASHVNLAGYSSEVGGIAGSISTGASNITISDCRYVADISFSTAVAGAGVGGIAGFATVDNAAGSFTIQRCLTTGVYDATTSAMATAGVFGTFDNIAAPGAVTLDDILSIPTALTRNGNPAFIINDLPSNGITTTGDVLFASAITTCSTTCATNDGSDSGQTSINAYKGTSSVAPFNSATWATKFSDSTWSVQSSNFPKLSFE